ncbi:MAG: hypothetical protein JNJ59_10110 [Deltaproteobacteria bacterium]|nr:hypothetical protein [Deltaproteobacteria bacterium]
MSQARPPEAVPSKGGGELLRIPVPEVPRRPPERVRLAWQLWLDGEVRRAPTPVADGVVVVLDASEPGKVPAASVVRRLDGEGRTVWERLLEGVVSGDPQRTQTLFAVPMDGERVVVLDVVTGVPVGAPIQVVGSTIRGAIGALGGKVWVRFGETQGALEGLGPFLAVYDPVDGDVPRLFPDPLGRALETHWRRTNRTVVAAAEHDGGATLLGFDETSASVLWRVELAGVGVSDLWGAGGLVDLATSDAVRSFDARTGTPLTRRFEGLGLELGRIAGETLLVPVIGGAGATRGASGASTTGNARRLLAFEVGTEEPTGQLADFHRLIGASSDLALIHRVVGSGDEGSAGQEVTALIELPDLRDCELPEAESILGASLVAFATHSLWVVAHGGRTLSQLDLATQRPS